MTKTKVIQPILACVAVFMMLVLIFAFAGCGQTQTKLAKKGMDSTIEMWEQLKVDAEAAKTTQSSTLTSLGGDASDLTLKDGMTADQTGVGQFLCLSFSSIGMYVGHTMASDTNYKFGSVFSGSGAFTQETANSSSLWNGTAGMVLKVTRGVFNVDNNVISGEFIIENPVVSNAGSEFQFYTKFEATIDKKTYDVTNFSLVFYDNDAQNAGENLWYFTGVTYDAMKGIYINVSKTSVQAEKTFANKIKAQGTSLLGKTVTIEDKDFATAVNAGAVSGAQLTEALFDM